MDLGDWPPFYSLSVMLRAGAQHPANRIGEFVDEANSAVNRPVYICFSLLSLPTTGKKYSLLSLIARRPAQALGSDRLHVSCSAPASKSWTDGQHQAGGAAKSGRWAWYPQLCSAAAAEHRVIFPCAQLQAVAFTLVGLVPNLCARGWYQTLTLAASAKAAKAGVWFAGCEEEREQDHCYGYSGSGRGPKLYFFLRLKIFVSLNKNKRSSKKNKDGEGEKSASLQLLERSKKWVF